jgi:transposase
MTHCIVIGMDVHKNSIDVAIADGILNGEVRYYGKIDAELPDIDRLIRKLGYKKKRLRIVYEAGPCGYGLYRHLQAQGIDCAVVAPSLTPKRAGDRVKTDRRDAITLARLHRAGELTAVYVPRREDEAIRDLLRAREDAKRAQKKAKQRLNAFLLRHGRKYTGKRKWTQAHRRWLSDQSFGDPAQQVVLQEYIDSVQECELRVQRLTEHVRQRVEHWRMKPVVEAFQAMRGVSLIVAATMAAEIGDLSRFDRPEQLMAYLGLVPSEYSSGARRRQGSITKCGNTHARRVLVEGAWAYRYPARVSRHLLKRWENLPEPICAIGWKAQLRLCTRYRRLTARGKPSQVAVTAIAREMAAFMWAIARQVPPDGQTVS